MIKTVLATIGIAVFLLLAPPSFSADRGAKILRVGLFDGGGPTPARQQVWRDFKHQMSALGYVEGKNILYELRWAHGEPDRLRAIAEELATMKVDAIVVRAGTAAVAARRATETIPIVMTLVSNPIRSGLIKSYARPGTNVTGMGTPATETAVKRLELLKEIVPATSRVAILGANVHPNFRPTVIRMKTAAEKLGISLVEVGITGAQDLDAAFAAMVENRVDGLIGVPSGIMGSASRKATVLAAKNRIPAMWPAQEYIDVGGLISYGIDFDEYFGGAARFLHRILQGAQPQDLPVERATRYALVVNLRAATALGITVRKSVLLRATEVIE